jgi:hypothetical protein
MRTRKVGLAVAACAACAALLAAPGRADAGDGKNLLPLLADDVEMVAVVDLADARDGATFETVVAALPASLTELVSHLNGSGIDLRQDVDTLLVAGAKPTYVSVLEGRFSADQLRKLKTGVAKKHRGIRYWVDGDTELAVLGKRLVVATGGQMKAVIDRHKKKRARSSAGALRDGLAVVDTRHDLWVVMSGAALAERSGQLGLDYLGFGATFGTDLVLEVRAAVGDADRRALIARTIEQAMPQLVAGLEQLGLASLAASLTVEWDDQVLDVGATVSAAELSTLLGLVAAM